ncbi:MFS transporter [Mycobacterium sp. AZCC_0083]|uniref:MFS transporter n=1 Tax=Mycobacterium sp. AZCC_0083 TaxID=2735882 RepID=UPI00160976FE|nr:MFS transporter [Mycobacterium sp. AZCC_0083]MBB5166999.1 MFS family permease [Mycobacterium sp. AZCC_0083]
MPKPTDTLPAIPERTQRVAVTIFLVTVCMSLLDVSMVKIALPAIQETLHLSPTAATLVLAGPSLASGLALIPAGRLGDVFGRRRLFLLGLWLFAITAVACAAAPNATVLVIGRLIHGLAGGLLAPQTMGMIQRMFHGRRRSKVFGYFGATVSLSAATGPVLGGVLLQAYGPDLGWRLALAATAPVALAAIAAGHRVLPPDPPRAASHRLDLAGTTLLCVGVLLILQPIMQMSSARERPRWWMLGLGLLCLGLFAWWERRLDARGGEPVIPMSLLRVRSFCVGALIATVFFAGFTSTVVVMLLYLQQGLNYTALQTAFAMLVFSLGATGASVVSGSLADRHGRWLVVIGGAIAVVAVTAVAVTGYWWSGAHAAVVLEAPLLVAGIGCGLLITANQTRSLQEVRHTDGGAAAGVLETSQRITTGLGTAATTSLYFFAAGSTHDFHGAIGYGLAVPILLFAAATLIGLTDLRRPRPTTARPTLAGDPRTSTRQYESQQ